MKIDNRLQTAKLKIFYMLMLGGMFSFGSYYFFEIKASFLYLTAALILAFIYLFFLIRKSDYFFIEFTGNKATVRYYTAHPFLRKYRAFEIPKAYFADYEIKKILGGFRKTVQFTIKTPKGKFKYPPLSISLLTKKQEEELVKILEEMKK